MVDHVLTGTFDGFEHIMSAGCRCEPTVQTATNPDGTQTATYRHKQIPGPSRTDQPQRWEPDANMVAAVLTHPRAPRPMQDLPLADRCWLVEGLTRAGQTAEEIAERMSCSRRLVMTLRAEAFTQLVAHYHRDLGLAETDTRAEQAGHVLTRQELSDLRRAAERLRLQRDQVLGQLTQLLDELKVSGGVRVCRKGLHPMVPYNKYRYTDRSGPTPRVREICRGCNLDRVNSFRTKNRTPADQASNAAALPDLHPATLASDP